MHFNVQPAEGIQTNVGVAFENYGNRDCNMEIDDVPTEEELIRALMT